MSPYRKPNMYFNLSKCLFIISQCLGHYAINTFVYQAYFFLSSCYASLRSYIYFSEYLEILTDVKFSQFQVSTNELKLQKQNTLPTLCSVYTGLDSHMVENAAIGIFFLFFCTASFIRH